jgi:DNA-directed RNA polymerase specialized sigma24 family protein
MERNEDVLGEARRHARGFLGRFQDAWTRNHRDDLVQEAAIASWRWAARAGVTERLPAAVRTIARRLRCRGLRETERRNRSLAELAIVLGESECEPVPRQLRVAGRSVPLPWLCVRLGWALARLPAIDRQLLLGLHEGFCCAELAARSHRSEQSVRVRVHRARRRVQREIERAVTDAVEFEVPAPASEP